MEVFFNCNLALMFLQILEQLKINEIFMLVSNISTFMTIVVYHAEMFVEIYYVLYQFWKNLDHSQNLMTQIDRYDQLILLDLLYYILGLVSVFVYVLVAN